VHHLRVHIHDERERFAERSHARGRFYCLGREVPAKGALIVVAWPKVKDGLGFPARAFAILP